MNMELIMQYITYALMAVGILAFAVAVFVQVIKELPGLRRGSIGGIDYTLRIGSHHCMPVL